MHNLAIKFENWNMKNEFSIFNFPIKIEKWKLKNFYHFSIFNFEVKIEMRKNVLFHFNFKMKIEWHFRCTDCCHSFFIFKKNVKRNTVRISFFIFTKEFKNELLKQIKINFMILFTSMIYMLFKSKFVPSPLRFSAVQ